MIRVGLLSAFAVAVAVLVVFALTAKPPPSTYARATFRPVTEPTAAALPVTVFIGDSYSVGTGATVPNKRWTTLLSQDQGWDEENLALGGTGYFNPGTTAPYASAIDAAVKLNPDTVMVSGGGNDIGFGSDRFTPAIDSFYAALREALPTTKIVVVSPYYRDDSEPRLQSLVDSVQAAATEIDARYLDIGQPLWGHPEYFAADLVHPDDAGYAAIFHSVKAALEAS